VIPVTVDGDLNHIKNEFFVFRRECDGLLCRRHGREKRIQQAQRGRIEGKITNAKAANHIPVTEYQ
jgi:hypothetical protein